MRDEAELIVAKGLLYDFYGSLLTPHQQKVYELAVYNDLSLSEIAETENISRQAVHDLLKRTTAALEQYESRLHMIRRFEEIRALCGEAQKACAKEHESGTEDAALVRAALRKLVQGIEEVITDGI